MQGQKQWFREDGKPAVIDDAGELRIHAVQNVQILRPDEQSEIIPCADADARADSRLFLGIEGGGGGIAISHQLDGAGAARKADRSEVRVFETGEREVSYSDNGTVLGRFGVVGDELGFV